MARSSSLRHLLLPTAAMCVIVVASNVLVQHPFSPFGLEDYFTWAAFVYPIAFLVTDLTNRRYGPALARRVVIVGFVLAVALSIYFATPRIAIASGTAFLVAQLLDVSVFDRLRNLAWWRAPLWSSLVGSAVDTAIFFTLAFASFITLFGPSFPFAVEQTVQFGGLFGEMPRWVVWAISDFGIKVLMGLTMLIPYGALRGFIRPMSASTAA